MLMQTPWITHKEYMKVGGQDSLTGKEDWGKRGRVTGVKMAKIHSINGWNSERTTVKNREKTWKYSYNIFHLIHVY